MHKLTHSQAEEPSPEEFFGWLEARKAGFAAQLDMSVEEWEWAGICAQEPDDGAAIDKAMQPVLMSIMAEESGAPAEYHDPDTWRRLLVEEHRRNHRPALSSTRPKNTRPARTAPRARGQRSPRRGTVKTTQDPGGDDGGDGDSDPDLDPVERRVRQLVSHAPPFSAGQRDLLGRIVGGAL